MANVLINKDINITLEDLGFRITSWRPGSGSSRLATAFVESFTNIKGVGNVVTGHFAVPIMAGQRSSEPWVGSIHGFKGTNGWVISSDLTPVVKSLIVAEYKKVAANIAAEAVDLLSGVEDEPAF